MAIEPTPPEKDAKPEPSSAAKEIVFFIDEDDFGEGYLAHSRKAAHQWLDAFFENLEDGEAGSVVRFKRKDMTRAEIDALPEI